MYWYELLSDDFPADSALYQGLPIQLAEKPSKGDLIDLRYLGYGLVRVAKVTLKSVHDPTIKHKDCFISVRVEDIEASM